MIKETVVNTELRHIKTDNIYLSYIVSSSNADNLNNVRRDANRHFRNKKKAGQDYCTPQGAMTDENGKMVKS